MTRQAAIALSFALLAACGEADLTQEDDSAAALTTPDVPKSGSRVNAPSQAALATGVQITEVAIFQGTRVALEQRGQKTTQTVPVVAGRPALIRAYVKPSGAEGAAAGSVRGELYISSATGSTVITDSVVVQGDSQEDQPSTTFDFDIPSNLITPQSQYLVRLIQDGAPTVSTKTQSYAQYPLDGSAEAIGAQPLNPLRVTLVPVQYAADGSNRLPDTGPQMIDALRKRMMEFYPVPDVQISVREQPVSWSQQIAANGGGWDQLLQTITQLRLSDNAAADIYYYGVFAPANTMGEFCNGGGCVLGLSNLGGTSSDTSARASIATLYAENNAIDTMPHEIGHAHGRAHAPCGGAQGADPSYPYQEALTGSWGYSVVTKSLKPPSLKDQMSYCSPAWQSDYTYAGLYNRIAEVQQGATQTGNPQGQQQRQYRMVRIDAEGRVAWSGAPFKTGLPLEGRAQAVTYLDEGGADVGQAVAHAYTYDHVPGGYVIVPDDAPKTASRVRFDLRAKVLGGQHEGAYHALIAPVRARSGDFFELRR